jgi:sphinganine-1-phosphate aldolase
MSQAPKAGAPLPREGRSWPELAQTLRDLKRDDLDWRRARHAAFVWHADDAVEQVAREVYALFMTENGLGLRVFPSLRRMETDVVAMVRHLLGGDAATPGQLTSGGTESIFLATHAARQWARRHHPEVTEPEIVAPWSAHPAVSKAAHYLGMKVLRVPVGDDFRADVAAMAAAITPRSVGRIREPRGIHLMLTRVHAPIIDEYLADLAGSVTEAGAVTRPAPTRAVY